MGCRMSHQRHAPMKASLAALVLTLLFAPARGHAETRDRTLEWKETWPRFRPAELAFTAGMALNVSMALFLYPPPKNNWDSPILFDKPARNALVLSDRDARNVAGSVSDG